MKNRILIACMLLAGFSVMAQERESAPSLTFEKKSERLSEATGWIQLLDGSWVGNKNMLYPAKSGKMESHSDQNFYWLQTGTVTNNGKKYYVLFYEYLTGAYKYPEIKEDWSEWHEQGCLVFTPEEFEVLKDAVAKKTGKPVGVTTKFRETNLPTGDSYTDEKTMKNISSVLLRGPREGGSKWGIAVNAQNSKGEDIVRFRMPEYINDADIYFKSYFEVKMDDFKKLLIE